MLRHTALTLARIEQVAPRLKALIYSERCPLAFEVAGPVGRVTLAEARGLDYRPGRLGMELGPYGSTYWFRLKGEVPGSWEGERVDVLWASHSEATLWRNGQPEQGLNYEPVSTTCLRPDAKIWAQAPAGAKVDWRGGGGEVLEVEVACNQLNGYNWRKLPGYKDRLPFVVEQAELARFDAEAWELYFDYLVLVDLLRRSDPGAKTAWGGYLLSELNRVVNTLRPEDRATWPEARGRLKPLLAHRNGTFQHEISAVGHGHIDTAWLWTLAEARRKCVRTFTSALAYAEDYPEYRFVCSQAQHYAWMREDHPALFERIKQAARAGNWVVTGGTWIEPDCNLPSGESLVRQFLHGQRFFERELGGRCRVFWNPDVFGYSGALPQIMRGAGIDYFLTQKLSWNQFNKPLHHNFQWEGIDGSRVLTHFPPGDSYNAMWNGKGFPLLDVLHSADNFKDHDRTKESLLVYGYGDGGGGPTREMLEVLRRVRDLQGVPRVEHRTPEAFFERLEADLDDMPSIVGELYFEYHRGTYTTQANAKRNNRKAEFVLREIELLASVAHREARLVYPQAALERLWRVVLLNQFHDIIPGSSIREVYAEADVQFAAFFAEAEELKARLLDGFGAGSAQAPAHARPEEARHLTLTSGASGNRVGEEAAGSVRGEAGSVRRGGETSVAALFNPCGWERTVLVDGPAGGEGLVLAKLAGLGIWPLRPLAWAGVPAAVHTVEEAGAVDFVIENGQLRAEFSRGGRLILLWDKTNNNRLVVAAEASGEQAGNQFVIYEDRPHDYDAWEVDASHLETRENLPEASRVELIEEGEGLVAGLEFTFEFGGSRLVERVTLQAHDRLLRCDCQVDWRERHRFLKVEFPVQVRASEATYEIQFGHVRRPTHFNTLHDIARFESCAHKWFDLSQPDYGVALLSESKYGCAVHGSTMRLSLLRAPTHPDPEADQGEHRFSFALYPHTGDIVAGEVVRRAWEFNCPPTPTRLPVHAEGGGKAWFAVDSPHLILDTVKKAEDDDAVIVRLYEAHGTSGEATLVSALPFDQWSRVNLLEDLDETAGNTDLTEGNGITFSYGPFKIISLRLA